MKCSIRFFDRVDFSGVCDSTDDTHLSDIRLLCPAFYILLVIEQSSLGIGDAFD
jgi:hypothetical protein